MAKNSPQDIKNREYFSNNLNRIMKEKGIRQIDLHNALKIPKSTITGYVKGRSMPTDSNLTKLVDFLNIEKSELDLRFIDGDIYQNFLRMLEERFEEDDYLLKNVSKESVYRSIRARETDDKKLIEFAKQNNLPLSSQEFVHTIIESLQEYNPKDDYEILNNLALKTSSILFWLDIIFQKRSSDFYIVFEEKKFNNNFYDYFYKKFDHLFKEIQKLALEEAKKNDENLEDYKLLWGLDD